MKNIHLTDEILQDYIFTKILDKNAKEHLANCNYCVAQIEAYENLYSQLRTLPEETFSFDTSSLVMQKIHSRQKKEKVELYLIYTLLFSSVLVAIYFILPMIFGVFKIQLINSAYMVLLITASLSIILFLMIDIIRTQKEKELQLYL